MLKSMDQRRKPKFVVKGEMNFSFGKNGLGLSDEFLELGKVIALLSEDNYIYMKESFIDNCDDVYDLKFDIIPHDENKWVLERRFNSEPLNHTAAAEPKEFTSKVDEGIE
jgi:hypothetical protein